MDDENRLGKPLAEETGENQTRKILKLLNKSRGLEKANEKVKSLLKKQDLPMNIKLQEEEN